MIFNLSGGGGDAELNFAVVGGTVRPTDPVANTIWVDTDTPITGWRFASDIPSVGEDGVVYIQTGTSSDVWFNVLKKDDDLATNTVIVYPKTLKQYVNGSFVNKNAYRYLDGWTQWSYEYVYLFNNGPVDGITWTGYTPAGTITTSGETLKMELPAKHPTDDNYVAHLSQQTSVSVGSATKLNIHFTRLSATNGNTGNYPLSISIDGGSSYVKQYKDISLADLGDDILTINVSGVSTVKLYFHSHLWESQNSTCYLTIDQIWLE